MNTTPRRRFVQFLVTSRGAFVDQGAYLDGELIPAVPGSDCDGQRANVRLTASSHALLWCGPTDPTVREATFTITSASGKTGHFMRSSFTLTRDDSQRDVLAGALGEGGGGVFCVADGGAEASDSRYGFLIAMAVIVVVLGIVGGVVARRVKGRREGKALWSALEEVEAEEGRRSEAEAAARERRERRRDGMHPDGSGGVELVPVEEPRER